MEHPARRIPALALTLLLAACSDDCPPATTLPAGPAAAAIAAVPPDELRSRAMQAMSDRRYFSPAGASAAELLLELRARGRATRGDEAALVELQPYLVIAVEQAIERRDPVEASRLLGLLRGIDARAPSLPRLDASVASVRARIEAQAQAQALVRAEAQRVAGPPVDGRSVTAAPAASDAARTPRPLVQVPAAAASASTAPPSVPQAAPSESPSPAVVATPVRPAAVAAADAEAPVRAAPALRLVQDVRPRYPARALERRIDGRVELVFTVQPDGSVRDLRVVDAQPAGIFDQAALQAARRWRFAPIASAATTSRTLRFTPPPG